MAIVAGMGGASLLFYLAPWPLLYVPALLALAVLAWLQLDLLLPFVAAYAPFFMVPKHVVRWEFAPSEVLILLAALLALVCALLPARRSMLRWEALRGSPFLWPGGLLLVAGALSTVFAADRHHALQWYRTVLLEPAVYGALLLLLLHRRRLWLLAVWSVVLTGTVVGIVGIVGLVTGSNTSTVPGSSLRRLNSVYGSPDNVGLLYDRVIPLWLGLALAWKGNRWKVGWVWIPALVLLPVLFLTYSRGAWVGVVGGCALIVALLYRKVVWLLAAVALIAIAAGILLGPRVANAFTSGHTHTVERRVDVWRSGLQMLRNHPVVGIGPDNFLHYYTPTRAEDRWQRQCPPGLGYMQPGEGDEPCLSHPHDEFLDAWLSTGILGFGAFIWIVVRFWRGAIRAWQRRRESALLLGAMGAMAAALLHGAVDNSYFLVDLATLFWLLCALVSWIGTEEPAG